MLILHTWQWLDTGLYLDFITTVTNRWLHFKEGIIEKNNKTVVQRGSIPQIRSNS
jgi:hypothetical protein